MSSQTEVTLAKKHPEVTLTNIAAALDSHPTVTYNNNALPMRRIGQHEERPERRIGFAGRQHLQQVLLFYCLSENKSDKPRGLRGGAPSSSPNDGSTETEKAMAKNTHLTLSDRIAIEVGLRERKSFFAIAEELG